MCALGMHLVRSSLRVKQWRSVIAGRSVCSVLSCGERLGLDRCRMRRSAQGTGGAPFSTKAKVFITRNAETTFELHGKHVLPAIHICNLNHKCDTHIATEVLLPFRLPLVPYNKNTRIR